MTADALRARIGKDHARLRELEAKIAACDASRRRSFDAMLMQARADITKLEIELAGMGGNACPNCRAEIPAHFLICLVCLREVPFKLWATFKGAVGLHHHGYVNDAYLNNARLAVLSHLKQFSSTL